MPKYLYLKTSFLLIPAMFLILQTSFLPPKNGGQLTNLNFGEQRYILAGVSPKIKASFLAGQITGNTPAKAGAVAGVDVSNPGQNKLKNILNNINSLLNSFCNLNPICYGI